MSGAGGATGPAIIGGAWAALALAGLGRWRPPGRPARRPPPPVGAGPIPSANPGPLERLGRVVLRVGHPADARRAGMAVVAAALVLPVAPPLALVPLAAARAWPVAAARRLRAARRRAVEAALPEAVDLLALAVGAGCNVALAVAAAGRRGTGPVAVELARVSDGVANGARLADSLDRLPERLGPAVEALAATLASCERYGAPVVPALERLGADVRRAGRRRAEEAARKVPVLLVFPLVICILPAFALLTVAPLVAGALGQLRL